MLDVNSMRESLDTARERLAHRGFTLDVETFQRLDGERKHFIREVERLRQMRNTTSDEIGRLVRQTVDVTDRVNEMKAVSQQIKEIEESLKTVEDQLFQFAAVMPNLADPSVPIGLTEEENVEIRRVGEPRQFDFAPKAHWDLGPALGILDLERGAKVTGSRFYFLAGAGARLPIKLAGYTPCFRSEAGSYGKDVRGIFRVHQFNKVELVKFSIPEESNNELETLTNDAEKILQRLNIPYRVMIHSTGDMCFAA